MRKTILLILLTAVSSSAMAAEWVEIDSDGNVTAYADLATIRSSGDRVKMWNLIDYKTARAGNPYMSIRAQSEFDCKRERMRSLFLSFYSRNMGRGHIVDSDNDPAKWERIAPGSVDDSLWKIACGKR
jgi:Surface-adhesin protein E